MRRREFIAVLGGAAAWPVVARAQQVDRVRSIGVLLARDENDPVAKTYLSAFTQALVGLGWAVGRNVRMDLRWAGGDTNRIRALAQELVGLQPEIMVPIGNPATVAIQRETRTIPIIAKQRLKHPSSLLGASREAALSSCRICSRPCIARR
jgi:putative ABC transport system substrate-binding protein